jgi:hypothetical protein
MRSLCNGLGVALVCLFGCTTTDPTRKPPPPVAEYVVPPADDARFSRPPSFPEKYLNSGMPKKETPNPFQQNGPGGLRGAGPANSGTMGGGMGSGGY